ncbi:MAG TPA: fumarylacetoacetate hydrolase, partial [Devosia sp.]|nr:fumarylacetoacetate hydrolase [Devosia sp.]
MSDEILPADGTLLGRAHVPGPAFPRLVTVREGRVLDITSAKAPTVRDLCEHADPAGFVAAADGQDIGSVGDLAANSAPGTLDPARPYLLSPIDLQAVKAAGVTFVVSLLERVIEEQARGDKARAEALRGEITGLIGT